MLVFMQEARLDNGFRIGTCDQGGDLIPYERKIVFIDQLKDTPPQQLILFVAQHLLGSRIDVRNPAVCF